tara:strand:+ start:57 stop:377 length:321 start_codon:yes stop_codon:yes gene_type:complete
MKTILNLIILNLIQIILTVATIFLLTSCAPPNSPLWIRSMETLPKVEGFMQSGVFTINGKLYVQNCDSTGNQIWMRYNEETHSWRQSRYNSLGCVRGESATGPDPS